MLRWNLKIYRSCEATLVKHTTSEMKKVKVKVMIFIAMQPAKVEMIQDNYTTLQNTK